MRVNTIWFLMLKIYIIFFLISSEAKRARLSINFLLGLKRFITADESPIALIPFVARPQIEEQICKVLNQNLSNMTPKPTPRTQDYCGIIISGGSGTGKTRI